MILGLYRVAGILGEPVIRGWLARRRVRGKEDTVRFRERRGITAMARPAGPLIWIHAASVGEAISILSLVDRLHAERPGMTLLVTTGTVTSAEIMADRLPRGVLHQYAPVDIPRWSRRFLDHWQPDLVLWLESEFWPTLLSAITARRIPLVLVNARISQRSFKGWQRIRGTIAALLQCFSLCLAQSADDGRKLTALGARDVRVPGNLKFTAAPLPVDEEALADISDQVGDRPVWAAVSTHEGEEQILADAHHRIAAAIENALLIIAPRHPVRGEIIAQELDDAGYRVLRRSSGEAISPDTQIYVVDSVGELGLVYRLAKVAFIGGSLIPHGGQNLLEAAKLGCAIVHGPSMFNFKDIVEEMQEAGAAETVEDAAGIAGAVIALLQDNPSRQTRIRAAAGVAERKGAILDAVMAELTPFLDRIGGGSGPEKGGPNGHART